MCVCVCVVCVLHACRVCLVCVSVSACMQCVHVSERAYACLFVILCVTRKYLPNYITCLMSDVYFFSIDTSGRCVW